MDRKYIVFVWERTLRSLTKARKAQERDMHACMLVRLCCTGIHVHWLHLKVWNQGEEIQFLSCLTLTIDA